MANALLENMSGAFNGGNVLPTGTAFFKNHFKWVEIDIS